MIYFILLLCTIPITAEQRAKYEPICLKKIAGEHAQPRVAKFHTKRMDNCIVMQVLAERNKGITHGA